MCSWVWWRPVEVARLTSHDVEPKRAATAAPTSGCPCEPVGSAAATSRSFDHSQEPDRAWWSATNIVCLGLPAFVATTHGHRSTCQHQSTAVLTTHTQLKLTDRQLKWARVSYRVHTDSWNSMKHRYRELQWAIYCTQTATTDRQTDILQHRQPETTHRQLKLTNRQRYSYGQSYVNPIALFYYIYRQKILLLFYLYFVFSFSSYFHFSYLSYFLNFNSVSIFNLFYSNFYIKFLHFILFSFSFIVF